MQLAIDLNLPITYDRFMKLFTQSATLLFSFLFVLIVISTPLSDYMVPILGVIITLSVIFIILMRRAKRHDDLFVGSNKEVATITIAVMLAIFLTGGLSSNLYFLLYFLIFGIVFLFEPATVFIMLLGMLTVFFGEATNGNLLPSIVKLGSLVFFSPIAYFFGREFAKKHTEDEAIDDKTGQIIEDVEAIRENNPDISEEEQIELDDIEDKANELRTKTNE